MSCGCRRSSCGLGRTAICGRSGASARTGPASPPSRPINPCTARRRRRRRQSLARRLINEDAAGILPVFVRREPGGAPSCFRVWHRVDGTHASPAVLCFRSRWPAGPGSIDAAGVALSRKGAKSRTGGRKLVMLMARPIPRADLKKQESRWACRRSGSSHVSVGLTGLLNPT
jgi:hypothetical protein